MARMVDGALPLRGGALVSRLYGHIQHGDPATRSLVRRIMDSVCAPLYTVLSRCVLR
jgi:gamma-tubulin complex component 3